MVVATPTRTTRRAWPADACWKATGKRQVIGQVISQLKHQFALERYRAKTLSGLLTWLAAKIVAYTAGQVLNQHHGRPLRQLADLLV
jgi:hypothetical protein